MSARFDRPEVRAACVGLCAGWGSYATTRLLGERLLVGEIVPVVMMIPLLGMALGPVLKARSWLTQPRTFAYAAVALAAAVAISAHAFYLPARLAFPGPVRTPDPMLAPALLVLVIVTALPFLVLGRACARAFEDGSHPALLSGLETAGFALGSGACYLCVRRVGGYEAFLAFVVGSGAFVVGLWPRAVAAAAAVAALGFVHTKQPTFFTWELQRFSWKETIWSPNQKLDAVTYGDCAAFMYNNYLFFYVCPETGTELNHVRDLSIELGKRLPVRTIVNLGSAAGLTPFTLLPAYPTARTYYAIEIEGAILDWTRRWFPERGGKIYDDPRVVTVATEGRRFLETHDVRADFIFVDGIDTPFITSQVLPESRGAWFFTAEGYRALFEHLTDDGYIIVETGGNTPSNFAPIIQGAPPDVSIAAVWYVNTTFPMVGMPHFWVALTKSPRTFAAVKEAFASVPSARPVEVPARSGYSPPTDDRPLVFHNTTIYSALSVMALAVLSIPLWLTRHARRQAPRRERLTLLAVGAGGTALQLASITALARGFEAPATGLAALLVANLAGSATGSALAAGQDRLATRSPRLANQIWWLGIVSALALFPSLQRVVWNPFAHHGAAIPVAALVGIPGGLLWARALATVPARRRGLALSLDLTGSVTFAAAAPAIVAWGGHSWLLVGGAVGLAVAVFGLAKAEVDRSPGFSGEGPA